MEYKNGQSTLSVLINNDSLKISGEIKTKDAISALAETSVEVIRAYAKSIMNTCPDYLRIDKNLMVVSECSIMIALVNNFFDTFNKSISNGEKTINNSTASKNNAHNSVEEILKSAANGLNNFL